jgi:succinyl-CoA synthetase beta subunit
MAISIEEADTAAKALFSAGHSVVVIKAQIHAGGRGKGGGVKLAKSLEEAGTHSKAILGMQLVTHQTGPQGQKVQRLLVEAGSAIARELYLGIVLDRTSSKVVFMASQAGGMDIEEVAHKTPEKIISVNVHPAAGLQPYQCRELAFAL